MPNVGGVSHFIKKDRKDKRAYLRKDEKGHVKVTNIRNVGSHLQQDRPLFHIVGRNGAPLEQKWKKILRKAF